MLKRASLLPFLLLLIFLCCNFISFAQQKLHGTVYDYFSKRPLDAVTVQTSAGLHAITDSLGKFSITISAKDSVWFSYLSKNTLKYPVDTIRNLSNFEIALYVDAAWLPAVKVQSRNYTLDSIQNRQEYAKVFNFRKPGIQINSASPNTYNPGDVTAGLDLDAFINMFRFRRNHQLLTMQDRLLQQEQDKYINHRYTKYFVSKITGLKGNELDSFLELSKPSYELLQTMNELELGYYIEQIYIIYKNGGRIEDPIKKEDQ